MPSDPALFVIKGIDVDIDFQSEIALAIQQRVINLVPGATKVNCWIDDAPLPLGKDPPPHERSFSIVMGDGAYDPEWGGAACVLKETARVAITHMAKIQLDPAKKLTNAIAANNRSMLRVKREILAAMLIETINGAKGAWRPKSVSGRYFWDTIRPVNYESPKRHQEWPLLYQILDFQFSFFWDL